MTTKQISNPAQAFSLGATWGDPSVDNDMNTEHGALINNTGLTLYAGDIIVVDATGTLANLSSSAGDPTTFGVVGSSLAMSKYPGQTLADYPTEAQFIQAGTTDGNINPQTIVPANSLTLGFTNGNDNITSASTATVNPLAVGLTIITPNNSSTNATPQTFQVVSNGGTAGSWTAVGVVTAGGGTTFSGTTGSFLSQVINSPGALGPGWQPPDNGQWTNASQFAPGISVPIITRGYGRVNINGVTGTVAKDLISVGNATVVGARTANAGATAAQIGQFIAVTLEAYAARSTELTTLGFTGHDSVRAIIGKF